MDTITIQVDDLSKVSDGYHTIDDLYQHRQLLFITICLMEQTRFNRQTLNKIPPVCWKLDPNIPNWFLLYWESPQGQISYHIQDKYLCLVEHRILRDEERKWDGHKSIDVENRLFDWCWNNWDE